MSELTDKRPDSTREQILRAAAHQFAQRPYYAVGLDDILAEAQLTKGAMYFGVVDRAAGDRAARPNRLLHSIPHATDGLGNQSGRPADEFRQLTSA
jgi:hypothetical protein